MTKEIIRKDDILEEISQEIDLLEEGVEEFTHDLMRTYAIIGKKFCEARSHFKEDIEFGHWRQKRHPKYTQQRANELMHYYCEYGQKILNGGHRTSGDRKKGIGILSHSTLVYLASPNMDPETKNDIENEAEKGNKTSFREAKNKNKEAKNTVTGRPVTANQEAKNTVTGRPVTANQRYFLKERYKSVEQKNREIKKLLSRKSEKEIDQFISQYLELQEKILAKLQS